MASIILDLEKVKSAHGKLKPSVYDLLCDSRKNQKLLFQPRCGVGDHGAMITLLRQIESLAAPDILSITIDSYTRLNKYDKASELLRRSPERLNGYPLVSQGPLKGMELDASVAAPLEVRHGSPDGRDLFRTTVESGITSYEGGGIGYNLPYSKSYPLRQSLRNWREIDRACGELAANSIVIDRELFGTLSAVLVPPSISIAMSLIEAMLAANEGVKCISIAYPQAGNVIQDVAALRAIREIAKRHLPSGSDVFVVLHEFMGPFPANKYHADSLILLGGLVARLGQANKVITKSNQEAFGIPTAEANADGIRTARLGASFLLNFIKVDEAAIADEMEGIIREVEEITAPVIGIKDNDVLIEKICDLFAAGQLDIPFSTNTGARSRILPFRTEYGFIRYYEWGGLPFSEQTIRRNRLIDGQLDFVSRIKNDILYFAKMGDQK